MTRFRPLFWPTVFTAPMLLLLLALGSWQIERLSWKEDLIARRQEAVAAAPVPVPRSLEEARGMEFRHVTDEGVFLHDKEIFLGATSKAGGQGYQILTPLLEPSGRVVFVNRGFIPAELKDPTKRSAGQIGGTVRVQGLLRLAPEGKPVWFLPDNRPDLNYWFWVDIPAMSATEKLDRVALFYIDADATPNPGGWPKGGVTRLALPNNHLQYAITWFSLAVALVVIYVLYHRREPGETMTAYRQLEERLARIGALEQAVSVLHWDTAAIMPEGGATARAEQLATLRSVAHQHLTAPEIERLLPEAEAAADALDEWQRANLREMRRRWLHAAAVPATLVEAESRACSECEAVWRRARLEDDFKAVLPRLARVLRVEREIAAIKAERLGTSPYEALVDQYEPGGSVAVIDRLFGEIAGFLPDLLDGAMTRQAAQPLPPAPVGPFPVERQRHVAMRLMERIGFDFTHGRLDISAHPFCGGTPDDVRITTRYNESDFAKALMAVLHETGHALYQRGLPARWRLQPVGRARGMAAHESQSLFLEMQVCRSRPFLTYAAPILREAFDGDGPSWEVDALYRRQIRVHRDLIRVDADEVTYPLHVILRYRIERAMLAGDLSPADLPGAWAEGMRELLGVTPRNDREGCLQDIHWYDGNWGYFPTYTLGALIAAQLFEAARRDMPDLTQLIAAGEFEPLLGWLRERVHSKGSLSSTAELVESATGRPLGTASFERHLRNRYLG